MNLSDKTKVPPDVLEHPFAGIQLRSGLKVFGYVDKFSRYKIYIKDRNGDILDIPRRIIQRVFLLITGDIKDESNKISKQNFYPRGREERPAPKE